MSRYFNDIWVNFSRSGKMVAMWHFLFFFWSSALTKWFDFFQLFSTALMRFCLGHSKNVFVLILAHLEPELELFEVWEIMVLQIILTIIANVSHQLQTALARVLDEVGPNRKHF